jgi:ABC-2 type transport system permease protein
MRKIWLIGMATYKPRLRSGSFLILTFALPVLMVIAGAVPYFTLTRQEEISSIGYIDQTGQLTPVKQVNVEEQMLYFTAYKTAAEAENAHQQGKIEGYFVLPADYFSGERASYFAQEEPSETITAGLRSFVRRGMLPEAPEWVLERLDDPAKRTFIALNSGEEVAEGPEMIIRIAAPAGMAILMSLALLFTSSQMGAAVVKEKDQRAMEILITSLRPIELVAGKVLGISLLSLTQITVWVIGAITGAALLLAGDVNLGNLSVPWEALFWAVMLGVPGYFLYAVIASGIGIIAGDSQQAQQLAGFLGFIGMVPFWFTGVIVGSPNGAAAVSLSLFPLTGPMFSLLRMSLTEVPIWQLAASFTILVFCLAVGIWAVARVYRAAMLMYGKSLNPGEILRSIKQA